MDQWSDSGRSHSKNTSIRWRRSWLQEHGYGVRLLIGDIQYDTSVIEEFLDVLKNRKIPTDEPMLITKPALTVEELLRQVGQTEAVISARYHNLVMALIQNKPIMALSEHPKLDSLATDFGLAQYPPSLGEPEHRRSDRQIQTIGEQYGATETLY